MTSIADLPDEIVLLIFKQLTRGDLIVLGKVSRDMRRLAWDDCLWKPALDNLPRNLVLNFFGNLPIESLSACTMVCKKLRVLALDPSLWSKVVIFEPLVLEEAAEKIQSWIQQYTRKTALIAYFPFSQYEYQVKKYKEWKIYPSP